MSSSDLRCHAPATLRNRDPILGVLKSVLPPDGVIVEIASGTGEHAAYLAPHFQPAQWLPTDVEDANLTSIAAWCAHLGAENVYPPLCIDVQSMDGQGFSRDLESSQPWPWKVGQFLADQPECLSVSALVNINMIHISPWLATLGLMKGAAQLLPLGGVLYLYGPFQEGGAHTALSNATFDRSLRSQCPDWGVRHLEEVIAVAQAQGLVHQQTLEMPANNRSVIFRQVGTPVVPPAL
ncbi:DUF938 domain-containing protein [Synechococcales cyanobacterium C]|uniref:DUF938 domain-containing protein n=1 Tax=Petrachloros mirabilis ULC683 TaxID=2781853 RepID=A0A8K2A6R2_9CYAN|nr:DUF938 domain-containing protein [Petrachloros mirabilis]NCJ05514.1 DUF938 domain-containing protein [Petrachloros mirabilis ULC683]